MEKQKTKSRMIALIAIIVALTAMIGIGWAYLAQALNVSGTGTVDSNFKVELQSASITETVGEDLGSTTISGDTVTVAVTVNKPGDEYTCTFTVKNTGSIVAKYVSIEADESNTATEGTDVSYSLTTATTANAELAINAEHTFTFNFKWEDTSSSQTVPATLTYTITYTINYQQA